jgi:hypothetical protein
MLYATPEPSTTTWHITCTNRGSVSETVAPMGGDDAVGRPRPSQAQLPVVMVAAMDESGEQCTVVFASERGVGGGLGCHPPHTHTHSLAGP